MASDRESDLCTGFAPVANRHARVLILGSMPGVRSLDHSEYYAHPANLYWRIMHELFGIDPDAAYRTRLRALQAERIALWDVIARCRRRGSLDSAIETDSIVVNDFASLYQRCPYIRHVFFNGTRAEQLYRRHVLPGLDESCHALAYVRLPSTSPAHAGMRQVEKIRHWRQVRDALNVA